MLHKPILILFLLTIWACSKTKFSKEDWLNAMDKQALAEVFLSEIYKKDMSKKDIIKHLGEPCAIRYIGQLPESINSKKQISYTLYYKMIDPVVLTFFFDFKGKSVFHKIWQAT